MFQLPNVHHHAKSQGDWSNCSFQNDELLSGRSQDFSLGGGINFCDLVSMAVISLSHHWGQNIFARKCVYMKMWSEFGGAKLVKFLILLKDRLPQFSDFHDGDPPVSWTVKINF